jgi:hypothetical protein
MSITCSMPAPARTLLAVFIEGVVDCLLGCDGHGGPPHGKGLEIKRHLVLETC